MFKLNIANLGHSTIALRFVHRVLTAHSTSKAEGRLLLERQPAGFVFSHLGTFGEQALKLVGGEFLAQQRL